MLTSKQRSVLKGLASNLSPVGQVGKNGIDEEVLNSFDKVLNNRELIKINVLENCEYSPKEAGGILAEKLNAEFVIAIGKKVVLYRVSDKEGVKHIEL